MQKTPWFDCRKDGRPIRAGWYEWELFIVDARGNYNVIQTMAPYAPGIDFVLVNGRAIGITDEDQWRGIVKPNGNARLKGTDQYLVPVVQSAFVAWDAACAEKQKEIDALQARIDVLMLEYCPGEMTDEQLHEWGEHQIRTQEKKMEDMDDCPCCGGLPKMVSEKMTYGHGDYPTEWSVRCECGMRTKGIPTGYAGTGEQCKAKAAAIWNRRPKTLDAELRGPA